jgi:hypothetical protein
MLTPARTALRRSRALQSLGMLVLLAVGARQTPAFASAPQTNETEVGMKEVEAKVKVAYVYNFLKFVDWPSEDKHATAVPFKVCLVGDDPIRTILGELSIRRVKERAIEVAHLKDYRTLSDCHLLYVSRSEETELPGILAHIQGASVLTVSDIQQFATKGGMIGFFTESNRVRIEINQKSVLRARLKVSAKLLEIARIVT